MSSPGIMRASDIALDLPGASDIRNSGDWLARGGSCIAGPDGQFLIPPVIEKEALLIATIDHAEVRRERHNMDPVGHYSRPDVLELSVNRKRQSTVILKD